MDIHLSIPDELARRFEDRGDDLSRRALEALVAQAYRDGLVTTAEVQRVLGLRSRPATEAFLDERGALLDYSEEDLERDLAAIREVREG